MKIGIKGKFINHNFYQAILDLGCKNVAEFSRRYGISAAAIQLYVNLKSYPRTDKKRKELEGIFGVPVSELFPKELTESLKNKKITQTAFYIHNEINLLSLEDKEIGKLSYEMPDTVTDKELAEQLDSVLETLTEREQKVIKERFYKDKTLREVGSKLKLDGERIRQIEAKALRKLRHPDRSTGLKDFIYKK